MMVISFLTFLSLVILGHYFAWRLCLSACPRLQPRRFWLLGTFIIFSVFFLITFLLLHQSDNIFLSGLYVVSAVFFGALSQLMLVGALYWLLIIFSHWLPGLVKVRLKKNNQKITRFFCLFALCLFLIGTYNAFCPRVKTITLSGWPKELKGKSFVQLSDLHLGAIYRPVWLKRIVRQTNVLNPDFILISGDLFDGSEEKVSEFVPALRDFKKPVIFVPGNHDYYVPDGEVASTTAAGGFITLSDRAGIFDGLQIIGFNYIGRSDSGLHREITDLQASTDLPRIVINHVPVDQAEAKALDAKLMLSGHTHRGQIFPFSLFLNFLYGRFSYGLENYEGMATYTSAGVGTWGPPLRTLFPGEIIKFVIE